MEPEVPVTAAMIDAGLEVLRELPELLGPTEEQLRISLRDCYCAMHRAALEPSEPNSLPSISVS